jgi:hypothetical protein
MMKQKSLFIELEIGRRIKVSRTRKKFTLKQLINQTGFTKGCLSKAENFPSLSPLEIMPVSLGLQSYFSWGGGTANLHRHCKIRERSLT